MQMGRVGALILGILVQVTSFFLSMYVQTSEIVKPTQMHINIGMHTRLFFFICNSEWNGMKLVVLFGVDSHSIVSSLLSKSLRLEKILQLLSPLLRLYVNGSHHPKCTNY